MRIVALSLLVLWTLTVAGCQSKAAKVKQLQDQYNAEYPAYAKDCLDPETAGSSDLLTGKKLTQEEIAALEAKKKEREARCKPQADRLAQLCRARKIELGLATNGRSWTLVWTSPEGVTSMGAWDAICWPTKAALRANGPSGWRSWAATRTAWRQTGKPPSARPR